LSISEDKRKSHYIALGMTRDRFVVIYKLKGLSIRTGRSAAALYGIPFLAFQSKTGISLSGAEGI